MILQQGSDGILRQSLFRLPDRGEVLRGIGLCADGSYQQTGQQPCGKNNWDPMPARPQERRCFQFKTVRERHKPKPGYIRQPLLYNYGFGSELFCLQNHS